MPETATVYPPFATWQLRVVCYRKVRGHGNDISVREIFRHFDSEKHGESPGIDKVLVLVVRDYMLYFGCCDLVYSYRSSLTIILFLNGKRQVNTRR